MPLTKLEEALRPIARERIASGELPGGAASRMWGGHGTGGLCSLCDKPILSDEIEYEIEYPGWSAAQTLRFHMVCLSAWQLECARADHLEKHALRR